MIVWAKLALSPFTLLPGYNVLGFISIEAIPLVAVWGRISPIKTAIKYFLFYIVEFLKSTISFEYLTSHFSTNRKFSLFLKFIVL